MKRIVFTLATLGALGMAADEAWAGGALSYPMAAHVAAKYGIHHSGHNDAVLYQEVGRFRSVHRGGYGRPRGHASVVIQPHVWGHPTVVVPHARPYYYPPSYYYVPRSGITYHGRGFSIGIGF